MIQLCCQTNWSEISRKEYTSCTTFYRYIIPGQRFFSRRMGKDLQFSYQLPTNKNWIQFEYSSETSCNTRFIWQASHQSQNTYIYNSRWLSNSRLVFCWTCEIHGELVKWQPPEIFPIDCLLCHQPVDLICIIQLLSYILLHRLIKLCQWHAASCSPTWLGDLDLVPRTKFIA